MHRRLIACALAVSLTALASPATVVATAPPTTNPPTDDEFTRDIGDTGGTYTGDPETPAPGGAEPTRIPCRWSNYAATDEDADTLNAVYPVIVDVVNAVLGGEYLVFNSTFYEENSALHQWSGIRNRFERYETADCTGATELTEEELDGFRWVPVVDPPASILIPDVLLTVTGRVQPPRSAINPAAEAPVNLGLWFAVQNSAPISAEGRLGPLWARGTATLTSTTFDPGNGDALVSCDAGGTPLPAGSETVGEGPCGYTYTALDDVYDESLAITMTSTWTVTWETSDGSGASTPPESIVLSSTVPYDVYEIQTVGG